MKKLTQFVFWSISVGLTTLFQVLVFIYGWGLEPKSWLWILIIYPTGNIVSLMLGFFGSEVTKRMED